MKKYLSLFFLALWLCVQVPVSAQSGALTAKGGFTSRLLSRSGCTFQADISNPAGGEATLLLIFASYAGNRLQQAEVRTITVNGTATAVSETGVPADADTTRLSAFLLDDLTAVSPLCRDDGVFTDYEPITNDYGKSNLVTETAAATEADRAAFTLLPTLSSGADQAVVNGLGVLGLFPEGGPGRIYCKMEKRLGATAVRYEQFRTLRVIAPDGEIVCYYDFSESADSLEELIFTVPSGPAGIWTVSYTGGQSTGDLLTVGLPPTCEAWGVRGEMKLVFPTGRAASTWYTYVPPTSTSCEIETGGYSGGIQLYLPAQDAGQVSHVPTAAEEEAAAAAGEPLTEVALKAQLVWGEAAADGRCRLDKQDSTQYGRYFDYRLSGYTPDSVWRIEVSGGASVGMSSLLFATGIPGLLCPSEASARLLAGGTARSRDGRLLGGAYQAQVRDAMLQHKDDDLSVQLSFPTSIPAEISPEDYDTEALLYGRYGGLTTLLPGLEKQKLDSESLYYGAFPDANDLSNEQEIENFCYGGRYAMHATAALAAVAGVPAKLNPGYHNEALVTRSMLASFCHLAALAPDYLLREKMTPRGNFYPMTHVFFVYPSLAEAYGLLKDQISPSESVLWRRGLLLLGDKLANYISSETNQWSEIIYGHLLVYRATGEERFLQYFERAAEAITHDNLHCKGSMGQHSAGYYLEERAPSGSYQELSLHNIAAAYLIYRAMPEANSSLTAALYDSIRRAAVYESLYWIPNAAGQPVSPTSMNLRAPTGMMSNCGYPGMFLAALAVPEANGLLSLLPYSAENYGYATTMSHVALHNPAVAEQVILWGLGQQGTVPYGLSGQWTPRLYEGYALTEGITETVTPPVRTHAGVWDLDGMLAIKKDGWYLLTHYAAPATGGSLRSGLPAAVWRESFGAAVLSMHIATDAPDYGQAAYSCFTAEKADGTVCRTALENGTLTARTDSGYQITQPLEGIGTVCYTVEIVDETRMTVTVTADITAEDVTGAYVRLPVYESGATVSGSAGVLHYAAGSGSLEIQAEGAAMGDTLYMASSGGHAVRPLDVPVTDGVPTVISFVVPGA